VLQSHLDIQCHTAAGQHRFSTNQGNHGKLLQAALLLAAMLLAAVTAYLHAYNVLAGVVVACGFCRLLWS
jgi:Flp pilus assembly protein TadB